MTTELKGPFPDKSPYGAMGCTGSPLAYLIDPGAGSASDHVTRFWPQRAALDDIYSRGGSITALYVRPSAPPVGAETGMVLVPVEPTEAMLAAGVAELPVKNAAFVWNAMLLAAASSEARKG